MAVTRHWDVYACPGDCLGRSGLWNVAPRDMICPKCGGTVRPMRVVPAEQLRGAVDALDEAVKAARLFNRSGITWMEYDRLLARLEGVVNHARGQS